MAQISEICFDVEIVTNFESWETDFYTPQVL